MSWPVIVALVIGIPVVLFVPALVWAAAVSGLYAVVRDNVRRRVLARRRGMAPVAEEAGPRRIT